MKTIEDRPARGRIPRSRGAVIGLLLVILGIWGALIPFIGPNFDFAYTPGQAWTAARGWLEVLPGVATAVGGLLVLVSRNRGSALLGGWLAALGGAWFVLGRTFAPLSGIGSVGDPVGATDRKRVAVELAYFSGLGVLITFLAGAALARMAFRLARDVRPVEPVAHPVEHAPQPGYSGLVEPDREVSTDALTTPRDRVATPADGTEQRRGGLFRRHRTPVTQQ